MKFNTAAVLETITCGSMFSSAAKRRIDRGLPPTPTSPAQGRQHCATPAGRFQIPPFVGERKEKQLLHVRDLSGGVTHPYIPYWRVSGESFCLPRLRPAHGFVDETDGPAPRGERFLTALALEFTFLWGVQPLGVHCIDRFAFWARVGTQINPNIGILIYALTLRGRKDHLLRFSEHLARPDANGAGELELRSEAWLLASVLER
jgi:hypothetical protein